MTGAAQAPQREPGPDRRGAAPPPLASGPRLLLAFVLVLLLMAYPPLVAWLDEGLRGAFRYLAEDAFYYLTVAARSPDTGFYTFDGTHPTNGFHPLWQYTLTIAHKLLRLDSAGLVGFAFAASVVLASVGTALFATAVLCVTRNLSLSLLAAVPGLYWWIVPGPGREAGAQWNFVNGMESPLSVFLYGALAWLLCARRLLFPEPGCGALVRLSFLLSVLALTRLDDVFLFLPFFLFLWLRSPTPRVFLRRAAVMAVVPLLLIGAYLLFNLVYAGLLLPVSGATKSGGLVQGFARNTYGVLTTLLPALDVRQLDPRTWGGEASRVTQMLAPLAAAGVWLLGFGRRLREPFADQSAYQHALLSLFSLYVVLKVAYNFAFVGLWHQGHWYYPLCIMTFDWIVAAIAAAAFHRVGVERFAPPLRVLGRTFSATALAAPLCVAAILLAGNVFVNARVQAARDLGFEFWSRGDEIGRTVARLCPGCGVLSFDDGIVAYSLPLPTMNGLGLTLDPEAFHAKRRGELLALAHARGYRMLVSVQYPIAQDLDAANLREKLARYRHLEGEPLERWRFQLVYREPVTGAVFVRFEPAAAPLASGR